ncbi:MAG: hypothetical protein DMG58_35955 [Acidobacteria bacterium]|nr:MAG: hypothetical protein DMG58_35955 [Acidobacteriota bacterium]
MLQGAPFTTFDLDVVHSRDPANVDRLLRALESFETLIQTKEETAGEKDKAILPVLRRTLEEKSRQEN